jgi:hypothetical protein
MIPAKPWLCTITIPTTISWRNLEILFWYKFQCKKLLRTHKNRGNNTAQHLFKCHKDNTFILTTIKAAEEKRRRKYIKLYYAMIFTLAFHLPSTAKWIFVLKRFFWKNPREDLGVWEQCETWTFRWCQGLDVFNFN